MSTMTTPNPFCCLACFRRLNGGILTRMILCPLCGNKRCPKAQDHEMKCTGSNAVGQVGEKEADHGK